MAGLNINPLQFFAAQATKGVQATGAAQPVAKANPFAAYNRESLADINGDLSRPQGVKSAPIFGGRSELGSNSWIC